MDNQSQMYYVKKQIRTQHKSTAKGPWYVLYCRPQSQHCAHYNRDANTGVAPMTDPFRHEQND
jgi:hypothetical protein